MAQEVQLFSSGQEVGNSVVSSGILPLLCNKISECERGGETITINENEPLRWKEFSESNNQFTIITFVVTNQDLEQDQELVLLSSLPDFQFLCTKFHPSFRVHRAAFTLFESPRVKDQLAKLKEEYGDLTRKLIITGHSLGGSLAVLFNLWLLKDINKPGTRRVRPLCVTFGAPLLGDQAFQQVLSHNPIANSCFLHLVANLDSVPRLFLHRPHDNPDPDAMDIDSQTGVFKPFGTFLLCSNAGYTCVEDPEEVSDLLEAMGLENVGSQWQMEDYKRIVDHLMSIVLIRGTSRFGELIEKPIRAGTLLELEAIGVTQQNLIEKLENRKEAWLKKKMTTYDPSKKLNEIKIKMAYMEWYKKSCKSAGKGYYDSYKDGKFKIDMDVVKHMRYLTDYWKKMVDEAEKKPQTEEAAFRTRYLYAGNNYRRMIEPFDIAEFYRRKDARDYIKNGRSQHYIQLEDWHRIELSNDLKGANTQSISNTINSKKQKVAEILTEDSCFWAHVEEALIALKSIENGEDIESARISLKDFDDYVMKQIRNYAVSPEIFLEKSSFMRWWKEYERIIEGTPESSTLAHFMMNKLHQKYENGTY